MLTSHMGIVAPNGTRSHGNSIFKTQYCRCRPSVNKALWSNQTELKRDRDRDWDQDKEEWVTVYFVEHSHCNLCGT